MENKEEIRALEKKEKIKASNNDVVNVNSLLMEKYVESDIPTETELNPEKTMENTDEIENKPKNPSSSHHPAKSNNKKTTKPKSRKSNQQKKGDIYNKTENYLNDLENAVIPLPMHHPICIIDTLKKLPRSGKKFRINKLPKDFIIKCRSVYDHILSVANSADIIKDNVDLSKDINWEKVTKLIAYHELCEVILGDIPSYTNGYSYDIIQGHIDERPNENTKRVKINITNAFNEMQKRTNREVVAFDLISLYLQPQENINLDITKEYSLIIESLKKEEQIKNKEFALFRILDKIDPIIGIWRYLYLFKNSNKYTKNQAEIFIEVMSDFFTNTEVSKEINRCKVKNKAQIEKIIMALQDMDIAKAYINKKNIKDIFNFNSKEKKIFLRLIEKHPLTFVKN